MCLQQGFLLFFCSWGSCETSKDVNAENRQCIPFVYFLEETIVHKNLINISILALITRLFVMRKKNNCSPCKHLIMHFYFFLDLFIYLFCDCSFSACFASFFYISIAVLTYFYTWHIHMLILLTFYLLENDRRSVEASFLISIFTVLSFKKTSLLQERLRNSSISIGKHSDSGNADTAVIYRFSQG